MKDWIPLIGALVGFIAGISGTWWTQRSARMLETAKWDREQRKAERAETKQLYIDIVEYAEDRIAWLRGFDYGFTKAESANLNLHPNQLAGRVKMFASTPVIAGWDYFQRHLDAVHMNIRLGNMHERPDLPGTADLDDQQVIPDAAVAGEFLILIVRSEYEDTNPTRLAPALEESMSNDERYLDAYRKHLSALSVREARVSSTDVAVRA